MYSIINVISSGGRRNLPRRARSRIVGGYISRCRTTEKLVRLLSSHGTNADFRIWFAYSIACPVTHTVRRRSPPFVELRCRKTILARYSISDFRLVRRNLSQLTVPRQSDDWILIRIPGPCDCDRKSFSSNADTAAVVEPIPIELSLYERTRNTHTHTHTHIHTHKHTHCTHACANTILRR